MAISCFFLPIGQPSSPTSFRSDSSQGCKLVNPLFQFQCFETILLSSFWAVSCWKMKLSLNRPETEGNMTSSMVSMYFSLFMVPPTKWSIQDFHWLCSPSTYMTLPLAEWQGRRMLGEFLCWNLPNSNSLILEQFKSAFIRKYHFSPLFNVPVLLITTKIPAFGFVVVIQERLSCSITRHHFHFRQLPGNT